MPSTTLTDFAYAQELDSGNKLASLRAEFVIDNPEMTYLDGNSLGCLVMWQAD